MTFPRAIFAFLLFLPTAAPAETPAPAGWDAQYAQACIAAGNTTPQMPDEAVAALCACAFADVANSPRWGSVNETDLARGLTVLSGATRRPSGLPDGAPQTAVTVDTKAFDNDDFAGYLAFVSASGNTAVAIDPAVVSCAEKKAPPAR